MNIETIAHAATAIAVFVAAYQLWVTRRQAETAFEDSMAKEYRDLASKIPTKAFLDEDLDVDDEETTVDEFYHYFDLCNAQIFFRQEGRVSQKTWKFWCDGMESNLKRRAFAKAWANISGRANGDF